MSKYHIPLDLDTGKRTITGEKVCLRGTLTSDSVSSRYNILVLDVGDDRDYDPADVVPRYGRTAAELVVEAVSETISDRGQTHLIWPSTVMGDVHPDDEQTFRLHWRRGVELFLRQWPEGPQAPWSCHA